MTSPLAIIAGAGPGVGAAVARRFVQGGFRVALIARDASRLAALAAPLIAAGGTVTTHSADLSDHADVRRVLATIAAEHGRATLLVWNAAVWTEAPALALDPGDFDRQLRLGLTCALTGIQTVAPSMMAGGGSILLTGGGLALMPQYGAAVPALTAVKSALRGFVHASAPEFATRGLRLGMVTIAGQVAPGGPFDPARIAEAFWTLHTAAKPVVEHVFDGS
ncbi:SDR family NAD(P)-dependent oxidoreductase [Agrobacterium sp. RAC06]|uniref:SDR family NAD(P)-dependent oxidoreductase n=1 Tax=Agrobacterium sp. RAC06 TaxID=1842536 RepID=UPI00083DB92F|nr:SDR family oxidoreductase [Agrobacterium sp. RAC06]AOG12520.1 short chain dehydrogenase family protein [Agrobacterium sp. RAC06]